MSTLEGRRAGCSFTRAHVKGPGYACTHANEPRFFAALFIFFSFPFSFRAEKGCGGGARARHECVGLATGTRWPCPGIAFKSPLFPPSPLPPRHSIFVRCVQNRRVRQRAPLLLPKRYLTARDEIGNVYGGEGGGDVKSRRERGRKSE